jgi:hypothetical protein
MFSRYHIPFSFFNRISENFQSILFSLGEILCCDEKLLHYTGNVGWVRLIPSKPDSLGFWFYQACICLANGLSYLVYCRLQNSCPNEGISISTLSIIEDWADIIIRFRSDNEDNGNTVMVNDSYYATNAARHFLNANGINYIMALQMNRFPVLAANLDLYGKPLLLVGHSASIIRQVPNSVRKELLVHHWSSTARIGKKYVLANCFQEFRPNRAEDGVVPGYDHYKKMFNSCDWFNRHLKDKKYPHKCGGRKKSGQEGHVHKFLMAALIQNTFNAYKAINKDETKDFQTLCIELSDEMYEYSQTFVDNVE